MPLSEIKRTESKSIEDLIAQLDAPAASAASNGSSSTDLNNDRKILKGKRSNNGTQQSTSQNSSPNINNTNGPSQFTFTKTNSFGQNSEPLLSKNILTSKKYSKHSRSLRTQPKKNGAGGKFTWGAPGCELVDYLDAKDPNYDSEEGGNFVMVCVENSDGGNAKKGLNANDTDAYNDQDLKELSDGEDMEQEIKPVILEYFQNGDTIEVIDHLKCYNFYKIKPQLISYLIQLSLDNNNTTKELTSRLLRDLTVELFSEKDFIQAFDLLLKNLNDLILDNPDAPEKIGTFIARGIADKVLTKNYLDRFFSQDDIENNEDLPDVNHNERIAKAIESARVLVNINNHLYHLSHIWGNKGGFLPVQELTDKINEIIQEYHDSGDSVEAIRCLKELNVPHFHHEFVFELLDFALQKANDNSIELITNLLHRLCESVVVTYDQLKLGITRVIDILPDICLDVPNANNLMDKILNKCYSKGFIGENILNLAPNRSRKRFVSEGDGGKIKDETGFSSSNRKNSE